MVDDEDALQDLQFGFLVRPRTRLLEDLEKFLRFRILCVVEEELEAVTEHLGDKLQVSLVLFEQSGSVVLYEKRKSAQRL